jgi:hypothetical protein
MKKIFVAIVAAMVLLICYKQPIHLSLFSNKKVVSVTAVKNQRGILLKAEDTIQKNCIESGDLLHGSMFFLNF